MDGAILAAIRVIFKVTEFEAPVDRHDMHRKMCMDGLLYTPRNGLKMGAIAYPEARKQLTQFMEAARDHFATLVMTHPRSRSIVCMS